LLWGARLFREKAALSWSFLLMGAGVVVLPFIANSLVLHQVTSQEVVPFGNVTQLLYGVASGGERWVKLVQDHPELGSMPDPERTIRSFELIYQVIRQDPSGLLRGAAYQYSMFFSRTYYNVFSFVRGENETVATISWAVMVFLSLVGIIAAWFGRKSPLNGLVLLTALGVVLSVPIVPPADAFGLRMYAAVIPVVVSVPVLGLYTLAARFSVFRRVVLPVPESQPAWAPALYSIAILLVVFVSPFAVNTFRKKTPFKPLTCPPGQQAAYLPLYPGGIVRIIREDVLQLDWMPEFHHGRFSINIHNLPNNEEINEFSKIVDPSTLSYTINLENGEYMLMVAPTEILPDLPTVIRACGQKSLNPSVERYRFFYVSSVTP
jgi:hypothetical protein